MNTLIYTTGNIYEMEGIKCHSVIKEVTSSLCRTSLMNFTIIETKNRGTSLRERFLSSVSFNLIRRITHHLRGSDLHKFTSVDSPYVTCLGDTTHPILREIMRNVILQETNKVQK